MILTFVMILTVLMIAAMITDASRFIIPNRLVAAIVLLYPVMVLLVPERPDWLWGLGLGLGMFFIGFALFAAKLLGGGDVKLLAACSLYVGQEKFLLFIAGVALLGGVLAVMLLALRGLVPFLWMKLKLPADKIPRVLSPKQPCPYGLAIATAFLTLLWRGEIPGLPL